MSNRQELEMVRASAIDALCTLHYKMCERSLSVQQIAEVGAWQALHEAACRELLFLPGQDKAATAMILVQQCIKELEDRFNNTDWPVGLLLNQLMLLRQALTELEG